MLKIAETEYPPTHTKSKNIKRPNVTREYLKLTNEWFKNDKRMSERNQQQLKSSNFYLRDVEGTSEGSSGWLNAVCGIKLAKIDVTNGKKERTERKNMRECVCVT